MSIHFILLYIGFHFGVFVELLTIILFIIIFCLLWIFLCLCLDLYLCFFNTGFSFLFSALGRFASSRSDEGRYEVEAEIGVLFAADQHSEI